MSKENKHPYLSSPGILTQVIEQFRSKFPSKVDSSVLQKLSLAPKNESVVITTLRFLGFIDNEGKKTTEANTVFLKHDDVEFQDEMSKIVKKSYSELFDMYGDDSWNLERAKLIGFFRTSDETSDLTATRQSTIFETLSSLSGKIIQSNEADTKKTNSDKKTETTKKKTLEKKPNNDNLKPIEKNDIGLTVRIEINLPAQGDQETYDRIFKSIKDNLLK